MYSLDTVAQTVLPQPIYLRLSSSAIAKRLARGSLWSLIGSATSRVLTLIAMILAARILGQVSFGEFGLIQATLGVFGLMAGVGLGGTATRFIAQYAIPDPARAGRVIALVTGSSVITILLASAFLITFSSELAERVMGAEYLQSALIWGTLLMVVGAFRGIQNGIFAGLERFDSSAKLNIVEGILGLPAIVLFANVFGVQGALVGLALSGAIAWIVGCFLLPGHLRSRGIKVQYKGAWADWRILPNYSLPKFLVSSFSTPVTWVALVWVARTENGFASLGLYNAAYQWVGPLIFLPMILSTVSIPILVQEWQSGNTARFRKAFIALLILALGMVLVPATLVAFAGPWIMSLYGPDFQEGWSLLAILAFGAPLLAIGTISSNALFAMNRPWQNLFIMVFWGAVLLGWTAAFLKQWGVLALVTAFFVAHLCRALIASGAVLKRLRQGP